MSASKAGTWIRPKRSGKATIYVKIENRPDELYIIPGCKLDATRPAFYGDIFYGADDCLYDGQGKKINDQCCTSTTSDRIRNPYHNINS